MYKFDLLTSPFSPVRPSPSIHPELSFHCEKWAKCLNLNTVCPQKNPVEGHRDRFNWIRAT